MYVGHLSSFTFVYLFFLVLSQVTREEGIHLGSDQIERLPTV